MTKRMRMNAVHEGRERLERNHYDDGIDRISGLPDFIVHHIMSFLRTKDVARISFLSKTWKGLRASFPILNFDETCCTNKALQCISPEQLIEERVPEAWSAWMEFKRYVDATLLEFYKTKFRMKKFRLFITFPDLSMTSMVDKWLGMAFESGVQEVDLYLNTPKSYIFNLDELYILPESIFAAARFLTILNLHNCNLTLKQKSYSKDPVRFYCLQKLSLKDVYIDDASFHQIISSCHLIEHISLVCCRGIKKFHVFGLIKLKKVVLVRASDELKRIDIERSSLHTFHYMPFQRKTQCVFNVDMCQDVKNLNIQGCSPTTAPFLYDLSSKFPYLESLWLGYYDELKRIKILSHTLRKLSLHAWSELVEVEIDAPNLLHFHYEGSMVLPIIINAPCPWEVRINVINNVDSLWLMKLKEFLSKSNQIVYLEMDIYSTEHTFNLEDLGEISLPQNLGVEELILGVEPCVPNSAVALLDGLLWCFHPKAISMSHAYPRNEMFIEFLSQELVKRDASCCNFHPTKCWRHLLKDTVIVNLDTWLPDVKRRYAAPPPLRHYILEW